MYLVTHLRPQVASNNVESANWTFRVQHVLRKYLLRPYFCTWSRWLCVTIHIVLKRENNCLLNCGCSVYFCPSPEYFLLAGKVVIFKRFQNNYLQYVNRLIGVNKNRNGLSKCFDRSTSNVIRCVKFYIYSCTKPWDLFLTDSLVCWESKRIQTFYLSRFTIVPN